VGIEADSDRVDALLKELDGKNIEEVIGSGLSKLASVPSGGGAVAMASGALLPRQIPQFWAVLANVTLVATALHGPALHNPMSCGLLSLVVSDSPARGGFSLAMWIWGLIRTRWSPLSALFLEQ
jgi:hypothetical protein